MNNGSETYGAAQVGDRLLIAKVENEGGRPQVAMLESVDDFNIAQSERGRLFFNVDEQMAVIKKFKIKQSSFIDAADIAQFELTQCLLEPKENFYFDALPLQPHNGCKRFLTIAYHRRPIDDIIAAYDNIFRKPSGFKLNAAALTDGYLTFCRVEQGDLQALVNIEPNSIIIAFIYCKKLEAITRLESVPNDDISIDTAKKIAAELKMMLSFEQGKLFNDEITVPISRIILCGSLARDEILQEALGGQISTEISLPYFHEGYFQSLPDKSEPYQFEKYLIPLGLAVK